MANILDKLEPRKTDYSSLIENIVDSSGYIPGEFNYAWVVPIVIGEEVTEEFNLKISRMKYVIDSILIDGRSKVIENWMIPEMGLINKELATISEPRRHNVTEIFIMFNKPENIRHKLWLNLIF